MGMGKSGGRAMQPHDFDVSLRTLRIAAILGALCSVFIALAPANAASGTVVALGASNTYGKGVARNQSYPAQLEAMLRASGHNVRVINAGVSGETTGQMLARLDRSVPRGTKVVIFQPGGNDRRKGEAENRATNIATIQQRLAARGIKVILMENSALGGLPRQPDGQHLTPEGYHSLAAQWMPQVVAALGQ
jgi:acyl-CoA thioesterase I